MDERRSDEEIKAKMFELEKEIRFKHAQTSKDLIKTKIETLKWVLNRRERI